MNAPSLKLIMPRASVRWIVYGAVLALTVIYIRATEQPEARATAAGARAPAEPHRLAAAAASAAARVPEVDMRRLAERAQRETGTDPFHGLAVEEARRNTPPPPPPPPPQAPPLRFAFLGKLIEADRVTVFLTNGERNWVVRAGDTIDGEYRVETIDDPVMTLTYLALRLPQTLAIGEAPSALEPIGARAAAEALPAQISPQAAGPLPGQVALLLAAPSRATAGNELVIGLALPPGGGARQARVELAFDPKVLVAVGAPPGDTGRVTIELAGGAAPLAQVRFRVIAQAPATTRIGIEQATATDARGASLSIAAPRAHDVAIVRAGG